MSRPNLDNMQVYGKGQVLLAGSFATNGTSSPVASTVKGSLIASVTRAAQGRWTVTTRIAVKDVIADLTAGRQTAAADGIVQLGDFSNVGTGTALSFTVRNIVASTETDVAANANNRISFALVVQLGAVK